MTGDKKNVERGFESSEHLWGIHETIKDKHKIFVRQEPWRRLGGYKPRRAGDTMMVMGRPTKEKIIKHYSDIFNKANLIFSTK